MTSMEDLESLAARVPDGALLALAPEYSWVPMALIRALIRRRVKDLHLLTVPIGGLAADPARERLAHDGGPHFLGAGQQLQRALRRARITGIPAA